LHAIRPRLAPCVLRAGFLAGLWVAGACHAAEFYAGGYSFSDELGGFVLKSASGRGTARDPVVLVEEIEEAAPITLVIRRRPEPGTPREPFAPLTLVKVVVNRSERVWAGFVVELQEVRKKPSVYGDGLSFNQFGARPPDVGSDSFAANNRLYEPHDRIRFENGHVDPQATARFKMTITDPTPIPEFYLVQDPQLLSAEAPGRGRSLALAD
jgi:hypothetical protein